MNKIKNSLGVIGAIATSAIFATPAHAQSTGDVVEGVIGTILNGVLNGGRSYDYGRYPQGNYGYGSYGMNERQAVNRCASAVEQRLAREYRRSRDDYRYGNYGYDHGARVTGVTNVRRTRDGMTVYGVASTGYDRGASDRYGRYDNRYARPVADLEWDCKIDRRGRIRDTDVDRISSRHRNYRY